MDKKLTAYVDAAFATYGNEPTIRDTKEELLHNLQEKFDDLKSHGKTDEEAYQATVNSIGDIAEFVEGRVPAVRAMNLSHRDLGGADFSGVDVHDARFSNSALKDANFKDANLAGSVFSNSDLRNIVFDGADLTGARLNSANLKGASFKGSNLTDTDFKASELHAISFENLTLVGTSFDKSNLKDVSFRNAVLRNVSFYTTVKYAHFDGATMDKVTYAQLKSAGAQLANVNVI